VLNVLRGLSEQFQVIVQLIPRQKPLSSFNDVHADLRLAELNMTSPLLRHRRPLSPLLPAGHPPLLPRRGPVLPVPALPVGAPLVVGADAVDAVAAGKVAPPLGRPAATNGRPSTTHGPGPSTCGPVPPTVVIMEHLHALERHSHHTTPCWLSACLRRSMRPLHLRAFSSRRILPPRRPGTPTPSRTPSAPSLYLSILSPARARPAPGPARKLRPDASSGMVMGRIFSTRNNRIFFQPGPKNAQV
jgi:hypothetical protein